MDRSGPPGSGEDEGAKACLAALQTALRSAGCGTTGEKARFAGAANQRRARVGC
ncbi:hypothetical protein GCM10010464_38000 [Pseudonocardia yunnanensis]